MNKGMLEAIMVETGRWCCPNKTAINSPDEPTHAVGVGPVAAPAYDSGVQDELSQRVFLF